VCVSVVVISVGDYAVVLAMLRLRFYKSDVGQCNIRRVRVHRLFGDTSFSRCSHYVCPINTAWHKLDMVAA